jgi:N2-(2-carboxyethyl)arginine synthase
MRGAKLFLKAAHRQGVTKAFGIIGGEAQAMRFDEVDGLQFYLTRHETCAGFMADVYGRLTGKPQIAYSTFGPGATNLATGVCSSVLDRSPMLAVSAQIVRSERVYNQTHQCIDTRAMFAPMCKFAHDIDSLEEIPEIVTTALTHARAEVPGPVHLTFPLDLMMAEIDDGQADKLLDKMGSTDPAPPPTPKLADLQWLAGELKKAKRPVAIAGNVVIREGATQDLQHFLEAWQIPVVTTLASKGVIPESHPLHIGPCNKYLDGILHHPVLDEQFGDCDLMLLIGYDFGEDVKPSQWMRNKNCRNLAIGPNPNPMGKVFQPEREILASVKQALPQLAEMAPAGRTTDLSRIVSLKQRKAAAGESPIQSYPTIPVPAIIRSVREAMGPDGILCSDIGLHKQYCGLFSPTEVPNTFMCSNGAGSFGFGLPAGLGAQVAFPDRKVLVLCGDGGFHSMSQDLETAVRYNLPLVVVLLKDNAFGLIKYYQLLDTPNLNSNAVDFTDISFCKLAEAQGWDAHFVTSRSMLEQKIAEGFARRRPTLLELPVRYQYKFDAPVQ